MSVRVYIVQKVVVIELLFNLYTQAAYRFANKEYANINYYSISSTNVFTLI